MLRFHYPKINVDLLEDDEYAKLFNELMYVLKTKHDMLGLSSNKKGNGTKGSI